MRVARKFSGLKRSSNIVCLGELSKKRDLSFENKFTNDGGASIAIWEGSKNRKYD